jgi:hypothetical protein
LVEFFGCFASFFFFFFFPFRDFCNGLEFWLGSRLSRHCYSSSRRLAGWLAGWLADSIKNFVLNIGFFFLLRWFEIMSDWIVL